ncbi:hypothetical protein [Arthrobacter caoxuetaonis]|uniref:Uncharacterized protein n=1 Tax=Arthrobacter caoxuetaonis TaxID=2886935 RepID=A0A9X1SE79_9MICC|nr:hypothetical protein [Arthrobacter caoxuetaonis]MCC3299381.1 hypothetical protein [Arthrobacter caoxuetaonis]USQ59126.1 hypothetical protein NF551_18645 [Arthrobacter caoxuetaonis]
MSTCRVSSLNAGPARDQAPGQASPAPAVEPVLVFHTDYEWNSSGTRIRCGHDQCREVFTVPEAGDVQAAEAVFAAHQQEVLGSIPVELAALRRLRETLPSLLSALAHGVPALRIEADLFQLVSETDAIIGGARALIIEGPARTGDEPAQDEAEADPLPEETVPAPEPEEAEPEPLPAPEATEPQEASPSEDAEGTEDVPEPSPVPDTGVKVGDRVHAVFRTLKQGVFDMEATVIAGIGKDQLVVGSWLLFSDGKPSKHLVDVTVIAPAGTHDKAVTPGSAAPEHFGTGI